MPSYQPEGSIYIGVVPFDNSYRHTMTFASRTAQAQFMRSCCNQAFDKNTYSYVRMNNSIRVDFNAERLYNYNYVMYQNSNYGQKWFYAFIVGVNYINENVTELVLELDVIQTYWFDLTLTQCMVEREHVNDDEPGAHINPEPDFPFFCIPQDRYSNGNLTEPCSIVVETTAIPVNNEDLITYYAEAVNLSPLDLPGGYYTHVYSGASVLAFDVDEDASVIPPDEDLRDYIKRHTDDVSLFINGLNSAGAGDAITGIYIFPKKYLPPRDAIYIGYPEPTSQKRAVNCLVRRGEGVVSLNHVIEKPTQVDGYTPRNKKLLTFPYCYCQFDDNNGNISQYRYEFWEEKLEVDHSTNIPLPKTGCVYSVTLPLEQNSQVFVTPQNYNGIENNATEAYTFPYSTQCSWPYSHYENWVAQNALSNSFQKASIAIGAVSSIGGGLMKAGNVLGAGKAKAGSIGAFSARNQKTPGITNFVGQASNANIQDTWSQLGNIGASVASDDWVGQAAALAAAYEKNSIIPNIVKGNASGNNLFGMGYLTYNQCTMAIRREFAVILDSFFDMYGYSIERLKVPNVTGRKSWNYVKCQNSCHKGNMPANFLDQINKIFDAGITFWHTSDVGNYSLDNSIV